MINTTNGLKKTNTVFNKYVGIIILWKKNQYGPSLINMLYCVQLISLLSLPDPPTFWRELLSRESSDCDLSGVILKKNKLNLWLNTFSKIFLKVSKKLIGQKSAKFLTWFMIQLHLPHFYQNENVFAKHRYSTVGYAPATRK